MMSLSNLALYALAVLLGLWFVYAVIRNAVKQNDFTVVLMLIIGGVAALASL